MSTHDVNNPSTTDIPGEVWSDGNLPAQAPGYGETLLPGISEFTLPSTLTQLWDVADFTDTNPRSKTYEQQVKRLRLKFDKNSPLVIASGPHKGQTMTATLNGNARPKGDPKDPSTPWVSDLAYLLEIGLQNRSRPTTAAALKQAINAYAGKTVWIKHGLSANCRADKVRYILKNPNDPNSTDTIQDPAGTKGCGDDSKRRPDNKGKQGRYYTRDFKDPDTGEYSDTLACHTCEAILRGFPSLESFVPPPGK